MKRGPAGAETVWLTGVPGLVGHSRGLDFILETEQREMLGGRTTSGFHTVALSYPHL